MPTWLIIVVAVFPSTLVAFFSYLAIKDKADSGRVESVEKDLVISEKQKVECMKVVKALELDVFKLKTDIFELRKENIDLRKKYNLN